METIHDFLAAHANSKANDEAFTFIEDNGEKSQICFNELHQRALSIAQYLTRETKPGSRVVLLFPPGLEYIQAFLGCLYAGVIAIPLYPPQSKKHAGRVLTVIDDCEASLVLTNNALKQQLEVDLSPLPVLSFVQLTATDTINLEISCTSGDFSPPTDDQIAFLQYTSGSTGTPKGVVVSHGNIIANLRTLQQATQCSQEDVFCNWLPLFHDLGLVNTLLLPIFLGVHSILMSPVRFVKSPLTWLKAISEYKASICGAPNFAFDHCLERIKPHQLAGIDLSSWRIAFNAAEPVDAETLMRFSDRFSRVGFKESAIFPAYGMAEATVFICGGAHATAYSAYPVSSEALQKGQAQLPDDSEKQQILIAHGHVQAKHHLKIVSPETLTEVPEGQVGEIWFAGPSLAQGYWNDAEKTKASFGARLKDDKNSYLRTGDLGFIRKGELYISGRIKDVLIIKGRNYYPQDIEKLAYSVYPGLSQNGAAAFEINGSAVLLLEVSRQEMKEFDYKLACETIKTAIFEQFEIVLEEILFLKGGGINRTSSGKIQRSLSQKRYLADDLDCLYRASKGVVLTGESDEESSQQTEQSVKPVSELEAQLCALWQEVLGLDSIGVEDNFLNLGGHSLLATTLIAKIQKKWNVDVSIRSFFTANTIGKLAKVIETASASQLSAIQPVAITEYPLPSFAQERMWLVNQIESELAQYNLSFSLKLYGELNESFLQQAFTTILARHQALRTTFNEDDGQVYQTVQESFQFDMPTIDLTDLTKAEQESRVAELSGEEATKNFDLTEDLMLRLTLLKLSAQTNILLLTVHHIAADGWSLGILTKELNTLYSSLVHGSENPLASLDIQYIDYAYWQRDWLKEDVLQKQLSYWKEHLNDLPIIHGLPLDKARPAVQSFKGASVQHTLTKEIQEGLHNLAMENEATLFMLLNAAFASFLSRYSGEDDIVIGTPIANREQAEVAPLIGLFINNLVFRSDLSADPAFVDLLQQSKERTFAAYEHQQMPFEKLVDELQPERNLSHSPLFQVMLILQNQEMASLNLSGLEAKQLKPSNTFAQYDLTLTFHESDNGLEMEWQYASDLFEQSTIERMIGHFEVLIQGIIKVPETSVSQLPILNNKESIQLLNNWNDTFSEYPKDKCIHELFEQQVESNPNAMAATFNNEELTYGQLNQRANRLAHYFVKQGVKPDSLVGICVERSLDMLVSVLAIMKSGGAYLPLDPAYPKARLEYMIEDSGVQWLITQKHLIEHFSEGQSSAEQIICLDDESFCAELMQLEHSNLAKESLGLTANHLSYLIYTSGSTGKPKGVMLEHRNLTNFLTSMQAEPGLSKEDTLLAGTSLSFDIHALELYLPLMVGGRVVIASSENVLSPDELAQLIENHQITSMQATPATWKMLLSNDWQPQNKLKVLCGGEVLAKELKNELLAIETVELWNMYGPTETAVWSSTRKIENAISLGAPIANTQFYVLDHHLNPVPVGVAGELYIGGEGVARGYFNRPELTLERFIQSPFSDAPVRLYKTGDLVRWLPDGTLEYQRRVDLQVKVRGHRIELEEIESGLKQHPEIEDAVAHVWTEAGASNLVAYVIGRNAEIENELQQKLTTYIEGFLPAYMIPNAVVCLAKFPLTPNGKINRNALPKPQLTDESEYIAPQTATEKQLCEMWQQLLNIEVKEGQWISVTNNFFQLGGHSLLAARLVSQIRKKWNVEIPIRTLFAQQTVAKLATVIENASITQTPQIVPLSTSDLIPLSFAQNRLWLIDQLEQGSSQFNLCQAFKFTGKLDISAMTSAFQSIIERHPVLRTTFQTTNEGEAIQVIGSNRELLIPVLDLTSLPKEAQEQTVTCHIEEESSQPFDLSADMMIRLKLLKCDSDSHILLVTMHHIAIDGWSVSIIFDEFNRLYRSSELKLPDLAIQYTDYARWQNNWLKGEVLEHHLSFWKERLQDLPEVHNLPLDRPRPPIQNYQGYHHHQILSSDVQDGLNRLAKTHNATLFMVLQTALAVLLARHSNKAGNGPDADNIVIGTPVANREQAELSPLVGFFVNSLVLKTNVSGNPSFGALLQSNKEYLLDAYEHTQLPFEKLADELTQERNLGYSPLFQVKLAMQNNEQGDFDLPELSCKRIEHSQSMAQHDLSLDIFEVNEEGASKGLKLDWEYATALFDGLTIERKAEHFEVLLKGIIDNPQARISELPLLTTAEEEQLITWSKWSSKEDSSAELVLSTDKESSVLDLFEKQAALHPDNISVMFNDATNTNERITYKELNEKANQVAHYLIEKGVKPDTLIGLCVERSLEMIIGMWGILKAGGAYVPVDPDYPEKHIQHLLDDSGIEIVLTSSELLSELPFDELQVLPLDDEMWEGFLGSYSLENIDRNELGLSLSNLAYVIYTSGSTGLPKGVAVEHGGLIKSMNSRFDLYQETPSSFALFFSFAFDGSITGIFWTLISGGKLCIVDIKNGVDLPSFQTMMVEEEISHFVTLPSVYLSILSSDIQPSSSLKMIIVAGEACDQNLVEQHQSHHQWKSCRLINEYGPTEACVWSSYYDLTHHTDGVVPIGAAAPHSELFVLDSELQLCPLGVRGELYIGGDCLARGYLNSPELTSQRFIPNPFNSSQRLYKTGDLVRCLPNRDGLPGNLEFLGRLDHQLKIRGFRIELGEIEAAIAEHEHVSEAVVLAKNLGVSESSKLVAYVVRNNNVAMSTENDFDESAFREALRIYLSKSLLNHKVPSVFVILEKLPRTPNGKVNRDALLAMELPAMLTHQHVAPKTDVEKRLCEIWQNLLKVKQVGITDNFFAIGGDSILSIQAVTRAAKEELVFTTRQIFECQTIEKLASQVTTESKSLAFDNDISRQGISVKDLLAEFEQWQQTQSAELSTVASAADSWEQFLNGQATNGNLPKEKVDWFIQMSQSQVVSLCQQYPELDKLYPTTGMQQGMLYHSSLEESAYVSQVSVMLAGKLNSIAFKQALNEIVRHHDVFRTVFTENYSHQLVLSEPNLNFTELDWSKYNESEQQQRLAQFLIQDKAQGFDFEKAPLMRITLVKFSVEQHYLIWSSHHALSDGWSFPLIFKDVISLYEAASHEASTEQLSNRISGLSSVLPKALPYENYIAWLHQQDDEQARSYWRDTLANIETSTQIQFDRTADDQHQGTKDLILSLTQEKSGQLQSFAKHHRVTLNTLIQGAWAYLLHRYCGEEQVVFGETVSGRPAEITGVEQMVGLFINSLPVSVNIDHEQEIGNWLQSLHQASIDRAEHGFLPLSEIQELSPISNRSERNLFDTLVVFENYPVEQALEKTVINSELSVKDIKSDMQTTYGLTLTVLPENTQQNVILNFKMAYQSERFEEETISRILTHLELILSGMLDETSTTVGGLPILAAEEESQLLNDWNNTTSDYPKDKSIHQLFAEQVHINPNKIAVVQAGSIELTNQANSTQLSNQQLYNKSHALALYLQSKGVKPDSLVGLCVERSLEMMVGIQGILQSGGAYVPLDPDYPEDRLAYMLDDSQAGIVITQERFKGKVEALVNENTQVIVLDESCCLPTECIANLETSKVKLREEVKPENLAYVIYTSGSTGQPKGVMIEHRMVVDYCFSVVEKMDLHLCETFAAISTFSSDLGNIALYVPMMFGKTLHLFSDEYVNNPIELHNYMDNHTIDCMKITPSHFEMFKTSDTRIISPAKVLIFAGEPLTKEIVDTVNTLNPGVRVFNNYGPTETTVSKLSTSELNSKELSSIVLGKPLNNTQIYILDSHNSPQPIGVPGELNIAGDGVARGYLNRPELTQEKFISNPFNSEGGTSLRMYKSGDLARWLADGNIEYLGRIDTQVKIRGFRIETSEIEARLSQYSEIKNSAVIVQGKGTNKQLIAFYCRVNTVESGPEINSIPSDELREHLLQSLPEYMLPAVFVSLEAIPLTANGKIDRRALELLDVSIESSQSYVAPRNDMERQLVAIWAEVLDIEPEKVGVNDSFFELGGHSLLAIQLFLKIRSLEGVDLQMKVLMEQNTIAGLAHLISRAEKSKIPAILPINRSELDRKSGHQLPLSSVQERMWFIDQLEPGNAGYNVAGAFTLSGEIDHMEQAFNLIIARHENLRTIFPSQEGQPQQLILDTIDFKLSRFDLSHIEAKNARHEKAKQLCQKEAAMPFDLANGPLIRGQVIKISAHEHILMVNMHHIITDAWSQGLFIKEFAMIMDRLEQGQSPILPPLPIQYLDYSIWQKKLLEESGLLEQQLNYWQEKLAGIPECLDLATDYPRPSVQDPSGDISQVFLLDTQLTSQLKSLAKEQGCTLFMTLLAAFKVLLFRYTGQEDICLGSPIANRENEETKDLIGMFVNTIALRNQVEGETSFNALLEQVKTTCLEAFEHQGTPFEKVVDLVQPERNMSISALFQIVFILHNDHTETCERNIQPYPLGNDFSRFDQIIHFTETPEGLEGFIGYRTALYKAETIERLGKHFIALCRSITATPSAIISELGFIDKAEKQQLLINYNDTQADYPKDKCIHQLFTEQVAINPDKTALVDVGSEENSDEAGSKPVSYQQLQSKSYALALYLQSLGVKPDSLVGLCVGRSTEMMVGILGVLQAGGAYVPLDPDYPDDRLAYILDDSQATIVLTLEMFKDKIKALVKPNTKVIVLDQQDGLEPDFMSNVKNKALKLRNQVKPDNLAYVIYTSGSTGQPKGVMIEHRMVIDYCYSVFEKMDLHQCETFAAVSTFSSDLGNIALYVPIIFSKSIYLFSNHYVNHPVRLKNYLDNHPVDCMKITPSHFEMFKLSDSEIVAPSKVFIFAGEPLTKRIVETVNTLKPGCKVFNNYGPTETTISKLSTSALVSSELSSIYLGKPLNNTQIYILDGNDQLQPTGVPGELHIAGDGVARGYFNRPELTKEKFIPNPFNPDTRLYKTGDLARWLDDGNIEYLGRIDTQVKIRGYRIELSEIEAQLNQYQGIRDSLVVVQGQDSSKQLIAFYVAGDVAEESTQSKITNEALREHLEQSLPEYMLPAVFVSLEAIPLMPNGKADRHALENIDVSIESNQAYLAPRNETEKKLVELWAEVLELEPEKIGINDNFFELGGHSLLAIMLVSKAVEHDIYFEIRDMFNHPNIQDLMENCEVEDDREIMREEGILEDAVALSPIQLYFFERIQKDINYFNQSVLLNLNTSVAIEDLSEMIMRLIEQHDALRFRYTKDDKGWQQHYQGSDAILSELFGLHSYDIAALEENKIPEYIEDICNQWQAELDIEKGPVMRWVYFDAKGNGSDQLAIIIHHLMIDNISWRILLEDLNRLIGQQLTNEKLELSQKRSSYRDWVNSLANYKDSDQGKIDLVFWIEQSKKTQNVSNPFEPEDYRYKDIQPTRVSLSETNTEKLLKHCNQVYGTDINDLLLTAIVMSYHKVTGNSDLMIEMEGHGRDDINHAIDITKTVGWFTSIYPVCFGLSNPEDIGQSIKEIKESLHEIPNKGVGFSIFNYINQLEEVELFNKPQVKFNYQGEVRSNTGDSKSNYITFSRQSSGSPISPQTEVDRLVTINGLTESGKLSFSFNYPKDWQGKTISHWQTHFISTLEALIEHCFDSPRLGYTPSDFPLLTASSSQLDKMTLDLKEKQNIELSNIQDIYPLTPLQSGILFETLFAKTKENKGMYLQQFAYGINGQADIEALQQAWQLVVDHYDALRTFIVTNIETNLQVVLKQIDIKIDRFEWLDKSHAELKSDCEQWMRNSKRSGINLERAPLVRINVFQGQESCYVVLELHHIIIDGWAKNIVLANLFKLYQALVQQQNYQLPPTAHYSAYVQKLLNRNQEEEALYWKEYLISHEERTPLPMSRLSSRQDSAKGLFDSTVFTLPQEEFVKLEELIKSNGLTMNNALQFIWGLLLHLQSGNETITFGSVSSGRSGILDTKHGDQIVGCCINTIPTCIQYDADLSLVDQLKRMQRRESDKLHYEVTPLIRIQKLLGINTNEEFFQSLFVYESYPVDDESNTSSMFIDYVSDSAPNYPLSIMVEPGEELAITFGFEINCYNKQTITALMEQFKSLIGQFIASPESTVKELSLTSVQEKQQLLIANNNTQVEYPQDKCIHQLFIEQVANNPDQIAVVYQDESLSYQQLYEKSQELALYLQSLGVQPDSLVGLCVERGLDMIVGILGILQAGGAYVPLDPEYPDDRLAYMLQDSQVAIVLCQESLQDKLSDLLAEDTQLIALDKQWPEISDCFADLKTKQVKLQQVVKPHHLAYVIYTSGSTGQPKGVMVEHKSLMNRIYWMQQQYSLNKEDIVLQKTPFSFDVSVWEFVWPMMSGASVVFAKPEGHKDAQYLEDLINKEKVTTLHFVPSMFNVYLNHAETSCSSIRQIFCSGEALESQTVNDCKNKFPQALLHNLYGPTEAAIDVTAYDCSQLDSSSVPIGAPIANTQIYILNQYNNPVPMGVPGELHIAGDGLARGYLNRPQLTQEKFIVNPFEPDTRMYKSGDLVRWLDDGNIEYIGRIDTQVKVRGFRIELGEIEAQLSQYVHIKDSVVVAQGSSSNKNLIAYYVARDTKEDQIINLAHEDIKAHLQQTLPDYMLPAAFVSLGAIPLTPNGKVNRRALANMDVSLESSQAYLAPRNTTEKQLVVILAGVLNLEPEKIGVNDNFFRLGGNSLLAVSLVSNVQSQLGLDLPLQALFDLPTISGMAEVLSVTQNQLEALWDEDEIGQAEFEEGTV